VKIETNYASGSDKIFAKVQCKTRIFGSLLEDWPSFMSYSSIYK